MKKIFLKIQLFILLLWGTFAVAAAPSIPQTMNYWFDECAWNGTTQQVIDHSVNTLYGTAMGDATTNDVTKVIQRATYFDGVNDYVDTGRNLVELHNRSASLSFWLKTTQTGNNITWQAPGITGVEQVGATDDIFWGYIDAAGHIGLSVGDNNMVQSTTLINDDVWHHIVLTRDRNTNAGKVYVDGVLENTGTLNARTTIVAFQSIGRMENAAYYNGYLDEVEIYEGVLSAEDVSIIYNNELQGLNHNGTIRPAVNCGVAVANMDFYSVDYQAPISDNVMANDTGTNITVTANTSPSNGNLIINANGSFTYTPNSSFSGADSFSYTITDAFGNTATASVTVNVALAPVDVPANLVAEYRLDECAFDGTTGDVIDNSKNRLNGTSFNTTTKTIQPNKICKGARFNGTNNYVLVPNDTKLNITGSMTVSFWVYPTRDNIDEYYISKTNGTNGWRVWFNNGFFSGSQDYIEFILRVGRSTRTLTINKPANWINNWHMITAVYTSGTGMQLYIDNNVPSQNTRTGTITTVTDPMLFGQFNDANYFQGDLDEVKIFNTAFSATQVTDMYTNESAFRNWNNSTSTRVCNTCSADVNYTAGGNFWHLISLQSDFRNIAMTAKTTSDVLGDNFDPADYDPAGNNLNGWILIRRDYAVGAAPSGDNSASYHVMGIGENLEYGKAYWLGSKKTATWDANLKTMDFDVVNNPSCRSANGKCVLVNLEEPNGTGNKGPFIYTMTSFPIAKPIKWENVRILIDNVAYTPDAAQALGQTFNATIWEYDPGSQSYTAVATGTPGQGREIRPYVGYWIELDKNTAGKTVQLLVPQE